mgnify:CR=1 FL=1
MTGVVVDAHDVRLDRVSDEPLEVGLLDTTGQQLRAQGVVGADAARDQVLDEVDLRAEAVRAILAGEQIDEAVAAGRLG